MFLSRTLGERFPLDKSQGPELRQGLDLFRVVSRTGLQIRKEIGLESDPCGRLYAGDVFCVNHSSTVPHHAAPAHHHRPGKKGKRRGGRRLLRVTRLHVVAPRIGWVTGSSKWVSKFQDGGGRPGPIPLGSTLSDASPVLMVKPSGSDSSNMRVPAARSLCDRTAHHCGQEQPQTQATHRCRASTTPPPHMHQESRESSTRAKWLYSRGGVWPVAVSSVPGPKYFPTLSAEAGDHSSSEHGVGFPKEERFLSNTTRYLSKGHERHTRGLSSPGPAKYVGHDGVTPLVPRPPPPSSAPGSSSLCGLRHSTPFAGRTSGREGIPHDRVSPRARKAATADPLCGRGARRRHRFSGDATTAHATTSSPPYMGLTEWEAAEKVLGNSRPGTTGSPVMRLLSSTRREGGGERGGPDGCFVTRMGAASPGPARHVPNVSCISSRGCPVFAAPMALDPADWEQQQQMMASPERQQQVQHHQHHQRQQQPQQPQTPPRPLLPEKSPSSPRHSKVMTITSSAEQPKTAPPLLLQTKSSQRPEMGAQAQQQQPQHHQQQGEEEEKHRHQQQHRRRLTTRRSLLAARPKTSQVHHRWPLHTHLRDEGRISGRLGQDSPGPGSLNIADHDPFRPSSFLKTDVCHPPPASSLASYSFCVVPFR